MPANTTTKVLIVHGDSALVEIYTYLINKDSGMEVAGKALSGKEFSEYFAQGNNGIDIALVSTETPGMDRQTMATVRQKCGSSLKVLVITERYGYPNARATFGDYVDGFCANPIAKFFNAIKGTLDGEEPLPVEEPKGPRPVLTPVELRILQLLIDGKTNAEIAFETKLTEANVTRIRRLIMHKFGAISPVDLGYKAAQHGFLGNAPEQ